jgi:D-3-phosphoglycerate dehydrogenase / 2-oxoglutarate reductase
LLNYQDVLDALNSDQLAGLGMDVYKDEPIPQSDPFLKHPKVVYTPHVAGVTESSYREMARNVAENVLRLLNEQDLKNIINY